MRKFMAAGVLLLLVSACSAKIDGTDFGTTTQSVEEMKQGLSDQDAAQLVNDVNTVAGSLLPGGAPKALNGMTRSDISKMAQAIRLKSQIASANERIETLEKMQQDYAKEDSIRDDAAKELAKISISFQPILDESGALQNCTLLIRNGSRHNLSLLKWRVPQVTEESTPLDPALRSGEERVVNDCGGGSGMESITDTMIQVAAHTPPIATSAELEGGGPDLEPWEGPADRRFRAVDDPAAELGDQQQKIAKAQAELDDLE